MVSMILPSNIRLEKGYKDIHATVYGSATQLHQVLLNLCSNAVQAMEGKGGTLTVQAEKISADALPANYHPAVASGFVRVRVADTGCGMTSETLAHIFDAFFTTKAAGEGTGLGLSVVQNILISHGGFIEAHSTVGEGSGSRTPCRAWCARPAQQWETAHPAGRRRGAGGPLPQAPPDSQRLYGGCFHRCGRVPRRLFGVAHPLAAGPCGRHHAQV